MGTPHKWAELIKAWADGAEVQIFVGNEWHDIQNPRFDSSESKYRIKPEPKPDVVKKFKASIDIKHEDAIAYAVSNEWIECSNLKLTFDGETGKLKSAEVL